MRRDERVVLVSDDLQARTVARILIQHHEERLDGFVGAPGADVAAREQLTRLDPFAAAKRSVPHFRFERLETNPRFAAIARAANAAVLARLRVDMEDRGGRIELLIPYATLEPVRELLLQQFMGEKFGRDSIWETHLAEELHHTEIGLDVVLDEQTMPLGQVMALRVGDRIALGVAPGAPVRLRCGEVGLFEAQLGRRENRLAVRIERELARGRALAAATAGEGASA